MWVFVLPSTVKVVHTPAYIYELFIPLCYQACLSLTRRQKGEIGDIGWHCHINSEIAFPTANRWKCQHHQDRSTGPVSKTVLFFFSFLYFSVESVHPQTTHTVGALHGPVSLHESYSSFRAPHLLCTNQWSAESGINSASKNKVSQWIEARQLVSKGPQIKTQVMFCFASWQRWDNVCSLSC